MNFRLNIFFIIVSLHQSDILIENCVFNRFARKAKERASEREKEIGKVGNIAETMWFIFTESISKFPVQLQSTEYEYSFNIHNFQCDAHTKRLGIVSNVLCYRCECVCMWL